MAEEPRRPEAAPNPAQQPGWAIPGLSSRWCMSNPSSVTMSNIAALRRDGPSASVISEAVISAMPPKPRRVTLRGQAGYRLGP